MDDFNYKLQQLSGADSHIKPLDSRISQTPVTNVRWTGARGASKCIPLDAERIALLEHYGQTSVSYDRTGEPDFRPFEEIHTLIHDMSGNRQANFNSANQKLLGTQWAKHRGLRTTADCQKYMKEHHLTWHECSDGVTMRLVNSDINSGFGHSGGVAELDAMAAKQPLNGDILRAAGKNSAELRITAKKAGVKLQENVSIAAKNTNLSAGIQAVGKAANSAVRTGANAALVTLTVSGINSLVSVAQGDKSLEEALHDVSVGSAKTFISASSVDLTRKAVSFVAERTQSEILAGLSSATIPAAEIAMVVMVGSSVKRYLDGDISADDCAVEILLSGAGTFAFQLGMAAGGPVGAVVASIVTTQIANTIVEYQQEKKIRKWQDAEIGRTLSAAQAEAKRQQEFLREYCRAELEHWNRQMDTGFNLIDQAALKGDSNGVAQGLDVLLSLIGAEVRFRKPEEFKRVFFGSDKSPIIM